jgi:hypothetical protein
MLSVVTAAVLPAVPRSGAPDKATGVGLAEEAVGHPRVRRVASRRLA